jgi:hypothetical protein
MFGARFAVFVRRARVLPGPCHATRNLLVLEVHWFEFKMWNSFNPIIF